MSQDIVKLTRQDMRTPRTRPPERRPPDPRRMLVRLVLWGVPVIVSLLTLMYAHKILEGRQRAPEVASAPRARVRAPSTEPPPATSDAEVKRITAEILNREAERRRREAQEREAKERAREPAPAPKPDPELERLRAEVERLKTEAKKREEERQRAEPERATAQTPNPADKARAAVAKALGSSPRETTDPGPTVPKPKPGPVPATVPETVPATVTATAPKESPPAPFELQRKEDRKREETHDLFERAVVYRGAREPAKLLDVLLKLKKLRPTDPSVHLGLGEVYSSLGADFDRRKASSAFQRFLDLTKVGRFKADSLHELSPIKGSDLQQVRLTVRNHLVLLRKKHRLLLVTSHSRIAKLVAGLEKELKSRHEAISAHRAWITTYEGRIQKLRHSRRFDRNTQIKTARRQIQRLQKAITREEGQIKFVTDELAMIRRKTNPQR